MTDRRHEPPPSLSVIRALGQKGANETFTLGRLYGSRLSRYATWLLIRTPLGPDAVTALGVGAGIVAGLLLLLPLGLVHLASAILYQVSYVLDFSDGEVARLRGRSSQAGSYLDWLGHFYVPCIGAALLGIQVADVAGRAWLAVGVVATLGLAAFHGSCREHIVVAYLRRHPEDVRTTAVQNALLDHPSPKPALLPGNATPVQRRRPPVLSLLGALLFYPGATHLLSLSLLGDLILGAVTGSPSVISREILLVSWGIGLGGHTAMAIHRNYRVLQHLDALHGHEAPWDRPLETQATDRSG